MSEILLAKNSSELYESLMNFPKDINQAKTILGSSSKYFLYTIKDGIYYFGLSKFCAFKEMNFSKYREETYDKNNGNKTQKSISRILGKWIPFKEVSKDVQAEFQQWIRQRITYSNLDNANFLYIEPCNEKTISYIPKHKLRKNISVDFFEEQLALKKLIGNIGEEVAYQHELERLGNNAEVIKEYEINVAAGYDIYSNNTKEERFIEVKSSTNIMNCFYISENEWNILEKKGESAFIYIVHISNLESNEGKVVREIKNPIKYFKNKNNFLERKMYQINLDD